MTRRVGDGRTGGRPPGRIVGLCDNPKPGNQPTARSDGDRTGAARVLSITLAERPRAGIR
jgi:hypothetical protein